VDVDLWVFSQLLELTIDLHGVIIILHVESSREVVKLNVEFLLRDFKSIFTSKIEGCSISF
jgi:hypothetical protein